VARSRLQNYLRTYRRRYGFSQAEIAMLLGAISGTKVSRYENFVRMPAVETIFAYEIIFDRPASELFAGAYQAIRIAVQPRVNRLLKRLTADAAAKPGARAARKLEFLRAIVDSASAGSSKKTTYP